MLESKPCYVTILTSVSPSQRQSRYTVHFKFELLLSLPSMFFAMNHSVPGICMPSTRPYSVIICSSVGYLILNTGISLVCVKYEMLESLKLSDVAYKQYTSVDVMYFTMPVVSNVIAGMPQH